MGRALAPGRIDEPPISRSMPAGSCRVEEQRRAGPAPAYGDFSLAAVIRWGDGRGPALASGRVVCLSCFPSSLILDS
jgi:hypothetical protein